MITLAMFPEEAHRTRFELFSFEGDVILDPFNGVGTTCAVAKKFNRKYVGIDVSQKYCNIAKKRVREILPGLIWHNPPKFYSSSS